jgi:drug/metabolite transporter (DMT)-like permease
MFPLFNGTGIILVALLSALFFKEKLTKNKIIGLLIGLVGLCLVNF